MFTLRSDKDQRKKFAFDHCKWTLTVSPILKPNSQLECSCPVLTQ